MEKRTSNTLIGMGSGKEKAGEGYDKGSLTFEGLRKLP